MGRISEVMYITPDLDEEEVNRQYYYQNILKYDPDMFGEYEEYIMDQQRKRNGKIREAFAPYIGRHPNMNSVMFGSPLHGMSLIVETDYIK